MIRANSQFVLAFVENKKKHIIKRKRRSFLYCIIVNEKHSCGNSRLVAFPLLPFPFFFGNFSISIIFRLKENEFIIYHGIQRKSLKLIIIMLAPMSHQNHAN